MTQTGGLRRLAPWLLAGLVSLVGAVGPLFGWPESEFDLLLAFTGLAFLTAIVTISFLGAFLRARAPDNAIGWLFIVTGIGMVAASIIGDGLANPAEPTVLEYFGLMVGTAGALLMFYPFILMLYIFPTGRFLSRRWSWARWYGRIVVPLALVLDTFVESWTEVDSDEMRWTVENPIGFIPTELNNVLGIPVFPILAVIALGGIPAAIVRYRRANLVERTQLRWLLSAGVWFAITLVLTTTGALGSDDLFSVVLVTAFLPLPIPSRLPSPAIACSRSTGSSPEPCRTSCSSVFSPSCSWPEPSGFRQRCSASANRSSSQGPPWRQQRCSTRYGEESSVLLIADSTARPTRQ